MQPRTRWLVTALLLVTTAYALAEELTLVTYYPSPRGVYNELRTMGTTLLAQQTGGVGIGSTPTTPAGKLQVSGGNAIFDGSVGIGTTTPVAALDIYGSVDVRTGQTIQFFDLNNVDMSGVSYHGNLLQFGGNNANRAYQFVAGSSATVDINSNGNVGIGTTTPNESPPNSKPGNLDANDVYLRSVDRWASQSGQLSSSYVGSCSAIGGGAPCKCSADERIMLLESTSGGDCSIEGGQGTVGVKGRAAGDATQFCAYACFR